MTFLLTFHSTLVCRHLPSGRLVHRPLDTPDPDTEPFEIPQPIEVVRADFAHFLLANPLDIAVDVAVAPSASLQLTRASDRRCLNLSQDGRFLSAGPNSGDVTASMVEAGEWESFLPVTATDIEVLRDILANEWVVRSSLRRVPGRDIRLQVWFGLVIDGMSYDLRYHLPFDLAQWPFRLNLLRDGWRLDQLRRYRPLVFYTAFQSQAVLEQLYLSMRSLLEIGRYDGEILVMSERSHDEIARNVPMLDPGRLTVLHHEPTDFAGYVAAKYAILDWLPASQFQPLLFLDADIICDRPIEPVLCALAASDRIAAPIEEFSALQNSPSMGATLLQQDGCSPRYAVGFNCGTLGIPNLATHITTLRLIRTVMVNHADIHGRHAQGWVDQEIANYVSYRDAHFDTHLLTRFVRYAGWDNKTAGLSGRVGLVHFWPATNKLDVMRRYAQELYASQEQPG